MTENSKNRIHTLEDIINEAVIFGDLRDHYSCDEIIEWFKEKCKDLWVRQATITVTNYICGTKTWTYGGDE